MENLLIEGLRSGALTAEIEVVHSPTPQTYSVYLNKQYLFEVCLYRPILEKTERTRKGAEMILEYFCTPREIKLGKESQVKNLISACVAMTSIKREVIMVSK